MEQKDSDQNHFESLFAGNELSQILFENASDAIFFTEDSKIIECNEAEAELKYKKIFENVQDVFYRTDLNGIITEISPSATLDSTTDGILVVDHFGKIISYNKQFRQIFNHSEELLQSGKDSVAIESVLIQLKDPDLFVSKIKYLYENPELESFDIIELKDGRILERFSCPQKLEGVPIGRVWNFRDVTERKKAEQQLQLIAHTLKSINECISITDTNNRILFVNEAFIKTYGYADESELIGQNISIVRSPNNDLEIVNQILAITADEGWVGEILNRRKDGTDFPISLSTSVVQDENGQILGMVGVAVDITERKIAEQSLKESEERYRSFFEGSPDAILLADARTGIIIDANPAASVLMKKPLNEIIGLHQTDIHPKRNISYSKKMFSIDASRQKTDLKAQSHENLISCSDGTEIPVEIMANLIHINGNTVIQGVFRNITARKKAEKALMESEKRFRLLIENQGEGVGLVDPVENFIFVNPAAEIIFGIEPGKLMGQNLRKFISPNHLERLHQESGKRSKNKRSTYEIDIICPDGKIKNLLITATPQLDDEGKFAGTFGVFRDITERKQAEELLRRSEKKYRTLIESMPDGVYRSTPEGKFVEVNPAMVKILGYSSKEELMAIDINKDLYFKPSDRDSLVLKLNPGELDVYPLKKKDGSAVWIEDHGWYVEDEHGKIIYHEGISRDVTDRKIAEMQLLKYSEELQELIATKDKFFSIIAHDLKTPFNSILGLSEILKDEARHLDIGTIIQYSDIIHSTSGNTYQLLENLLDWARIQQSRITFNPEPILLKKLINDVTELNAEKANRKKVSVINNITEQMIVLADQEMLKTILRNLISNALKFTTANGKIEIIAKSGSGEIEISVKDTGTGINKEDIEKLFKVDSNFTRRGTENEKGTGLGLILCKEFIEKHGGTIRVESEEGKGSTFSFTLKQV